MILNITAGEYLTEKFKNIYPETVFIPFNEAMIKGTYKSRLFSEEFIVERALTHNVSVEEYKDKLSDFLNIFKSLDQCSEVNLYFGDEPFCNANKKVVIETLRLYGYSKGINLFTVNEITGDIIEKKIITL